MADISVPWPTKPFYRALVMIAQINARCMNELYRRRHSTLLQMRAVALSVYEDILKSLPQIESFIACKLDGDVIQHELDTSQTVVVTSCNHLVMLNFRPFVIFKGRWLRDKQLGVQAADDVVATPVWLQQACDYAIKAARRLILNFYRITIVYPQTRVCLAFPSLARQYIDQTIANLLLQEFRYHGFFLGNACFVLIYNFIFDRQAAANDLPYVHAALHVLSSMRKGDPIESAMKALQTILRAIDPSFEWDPNLPPPTLCTLTTVDRSVDRNVTAPERMHDGAVNVNANATTTTTTTTTSSSSSSNAAYTRSNIQAHSPNIVNHPTSHVRWEPPPSQQPSLAQSIRPRSTPLQPQKVADFLINSPGTPDGHDYGMHTALQPPPQAAHVGADPYVQAMAGPVLTGEYFPVTTTTGMPDFSASDLGWDFATMDLEAFFSVYPAGAG